MALCLFGKSWQGGGEKVFFFLGTVVGSWERDEGVIKFLSGETRKDPSLPLLPPKKKRVASVAHFQLATGAKFLPSDYDVFFFKLV